jgi:hypothetical protein
MTIGDGEVVEGVKRRQVFRPDLRRPLLDGRHLIRLD